ncbi:MAG: hypothetical protein QM501_15345 [Gimesia sp.]
MLFVFSVSLSERAIILPKKKKRNQIRFRHGYGLGDLEKAVAENDDLLAQYYFNRPRYVSRALNRDDNSSVFIGPKGVGKSAILQMVRLDQNSCGNASRVLEITPDDLAFNALVNIDARSPLLESAHQNMWLFKSLWDYVLCSELLRREAPYPGGLESLLAGLFDSRYSREKKKLLELTLSDDGSPTSMTAKMLGLVSEIEVKASVNNSSLGGRVSLNDSSEAESDHLKILQLISNVASDIDRALSHDYYILIDDLDHHWKGTELQNAFLGAMFESIWKLSRSRKIKFVVSLRKHIYREVFIGERDKFKEFVKEVTWSKNSVKEIVQKRLCSVVVINEGRVWEDLFYESAFNAIWDSTEGTPREVLALTAACVASAIENDHSSVTPEDLRTACCSFSEDLLDGLYNSIKYEYPGVRFVIDRFAGGRKQFDIDYLQEIAFAVSDAIESGLYNDEIPWVTVGVDNPIQFAQTLLRIGFLRLKAGRDADARAATDHDILLLNESDWYSVSPRYQAGLQLEGTG